jgi:hypothetical protein
VANQLMLAGIAGLAACLLYQLIAFIFTGSWTPISVLDLTEAVTGMEKSLMLQTLPGLHTALDWVNAGFAAYLTGVVASTVVEKL